MEWTDALRTAVKCMRGILTLPSNVLIIATWVVFSLPCVASAEERHWYLQQGKHEALCEKLVQIANSHPSNGRRPNIPWSEVLAIKGVREPEWTELDPAEHEKLFLMARDFLARESLHLLDEQVIPFPRWFKPRNERFVSEAERAKPLSNEDALAIYYDFIRRGGKLEVLRHDMGDDTFQIYKDIVQYESPATDSFPWDGYSLLAEDDLAGFSWMAYPFPDLGMGFRILLYNNNVFSFIADEDEYRVAQRSGARNNSLSPWYCKVDSEILKRKGKK